MMGFRLSICFGSIAIQMRSIPATNCGCVLGTHFNVFDPEVTLRFEKAIPASQRRTAKLTAARHCRKAALIAMRVSAWVKTLAASSWPLWCQSPLCCSREWLDSGAAAQRPCGPVGLESESGGVHDGGGHAMRSMPFNPVYKLGCL